jgi:TP901 family phage tail tape measure protein
MGKKLRDEDLRLNIIINGDNGRKEIAALERSIHDTNAKMEALYAQRRKLEQQGKTETATYRRVQAQIGKYNKELETSREKLAALQRQQNVNSMTLSELRSHISRVQIQLNKTDPKSPLWAKLNEELRVSKQRLAEMAAQSKVTRGVVGSMAERVNRYIGLITAGFASMAFVFSGVNRARKEFLDYDEALVDAMKTTNLTREEISALSEDLKKIDTRTSQNDLLALVRIGGKLGIQGRDDLLAFANAADKINVALREDLGGNTEDAIREIGKLVDIFNLSDEFGLEKAMLMTGSAVNALGMASTANEGYIVEFTKRIAGIAPNADISIDKVLGLAAALDKYGQMNETSATAIGQTIIGMYQKTEAFAKVAKMELQDFRDLLNVDANEALIRVLEGMGKDGGGMYAVTQALDSLQLNGQRASTVLGSLAKHSDELRNQQEISNKAFIEGTSIIDEFNTKNESATAILEKRKKAIVEQAVALGEQLTPAINVSLSSSTWALKVVGELVSIGIKYKGVLTALATAYAANFVLRKTSVAWAQVETVWAQRKILLSSQHRIELAREAVAIYNTRNAETAATKSTMLWCAAKNLLVGNIRAASLAMKGFWASLGPIGWATLAFTALVSVVRGIVSHYQDATKAQRLLSDNMRKATTDAAQERAELDRLMGKLEGCRVGTKAYNDTKTEIASKFGKYDSTLKSESLTVDTLRRKYNSLTAAIMQSARTRQYNSFVSEQQKTFDQKFDDKSNRLWEALNDQYYTEKAAKYYQQIIGAFLGDRSLDAWLTTGSRKTRKLVKELEELRAEQKKTDEEAKARFGITSSPAPTSAPSTGTSTFSGDDGTPNSTFDLGGSDSDSKWSLEKDAAYLQKRHELKKQYLAGEIASEKEYNSQILALEIETLQKRLALNVDDAEQKAKIQNSLDDKLIQQREQNNQWSLGSDEAYLAAQLDLKNKYLNKEIASEAEYDNLAAQLEITALQYRLDKNIEKGEERIKLEQQLADKLLAQQQRNAQRQAKIEEILADAEADKIAQENRRYEAERLQYAGQADVLEALAKRHARRITQIQLDAANDTLSRQQAQYDLARKTMQNQQRQELALFSGNARQRKALRKRQYQELAALDAEQLEHLVGLLQSLIDTGEIDDIKLDVSLLSEDEIMDLRSQLQDLVSKLQTAKGIGDDGSDTNKSPQGGYIDNGATLLGLSKSQWDDLFNGNLEQWYEWADSIADIVSGVADTTMQLWNAYDSRQTAIENNQLKKFQENNDKKKKTLEKRLNAGLITEDQYNNQVEALDAKYDAFQEELALKQAKRQRAMDISQAIVNTAISVTKTFAQWGWPWGIVPAAIQAGLGAAQIALISSTPISTGAEEGGYQYVTRKQDGRKFKARLNPDKRGFVESPTLLVGENGSEYVIPHEGLSNPSLMPIINTMETARKNGTLRSLNFESVYSSISAPGKSSGGFIGNSPMNESSNTPSGAIVPSDDSAQKIIRLLEDLNKKADNPIPAVVSMLGRNGFVETYDKYQKLKRNGQLG